MSFAFCGADQGPKGTHARSNHVTSGALPDANRASARRVLRAAGAYARVAARVHGFTSRARWPLSWRQVIALSSAQWSFLSVLSGRVLPLWHRMIAALRGDGSGSVATVIRLVARARPRLRLVHTSQRTAFTQLRGVHLVPQATWQCLPSSIRFFALRALHTF